MINNGRMGKLSGTRDQLLRFGRCSAAELNHALSELQTTGAADVHESHGIVTVINRRMFRDYNERKSSTLRQQRHRGKHPKTASVTDPPLNVKRGEGELEEEKALSVKRLNVKREINVQSLQRAEIPVRNGENHWLDQLRLTFAAHDAEQAENEMANNGGKWRLRYRQDFKKAERVIAELWCMIKEGRVRENAGACADDLWRRFA